MSEPRRPRVDVGVVTWNSSEHVASSLRQVLDTDQGCDVEIFVRDNASTDGTVDVLRARVPEAEVDAGTTNLGFAGGVNTIARRCDAPWLLLLNPDAWPLPKAIGRLVQAADQHPTAAAIAPRIEHPDGSLEHSTHPFPSLKVASTVAFGWGRLSKQRGSELMLEGFWNHDEPRRVDWAVGAALLIRRSAWDAIGGLDERFFMYVEDLEWGWRARKRGWEMRFEPEAVFRHVGNVSGRQLYGAARTHAHLRNELAFYRREHGTPAMLAWWAVNVAGVCVRLIGARRRRNASGVAHWRAYLRALVRALSSGVGRVGDG